jgi:hypothetical protein
MAQEGTMDGKVRWTLLLLIGGLLVAGCGGTLKVEVVNTPTPATTPGSGPAPLVVADFDNCKGVNNLGGQMGAAYNSPDSLKDSYVEEAKRGCVARLEYSVTGWSAFWLKLQGADLAPYSKLVFDVRADPQPGIPKQFKLELKRAGGAEVSITYVSGVEAAWKTMSISLADFIPAGYAAPLSSFSGMEELVFTFEASRSGGQGVVYLDNIAFER